MFARFFCAFLDLRTRKFPAKSKKKRIFSAYYTLFVLAFISVIDNVGFNLQVVIIIWIYWFKFLIPSGTMFDLFYFIGWNTVLF